MVLKGSRLKVSLMVRLFGVRLALMEASKQ